MNSSVILEFDQIVRQLCDLAVSDRAKERLAGLRPYLRESECRRNMQETTQAKTILTHAGTPPLSSMKEIDKLMELCAKGSMLTAEQLAQVSQFLLACRRMKSYLKKAEKLGEDIALYGGSIDPCESLYEQIDSSVRNDRVEDAASPALRDVRRKIENGNLQVKARLESLLRSGKEWFSDGYVAIKNGRFVLPVRKECRGMVSGSVIDTSSSGATLFIEPTVVRRVQEELTELQIEEENEIRRVLYALTALVDDAQMPIRTNIEVMESLDFLFAKAKLSERMKAVPVPVAAQRRLVIRSGRHPLIREADCVPLDFEIGSNASGVVITGPNTGGKTVALKTVGLLSLMAQSGLHVPVAEGSEFCMFNLVLCDIGDGQSIAENLSTFSSHIRHIVEVLRDAADESLVLLDELGSGTDPAEGMGIAVAVLEELGRKGCLFIVTTHYPEIKEYAERTPGLVNARMAFDRESLRPLYRLEMGEAGESCALFIAGRLGFPSRLLKIAREAAYRHANPPAQAELPEIAESGQPSESSARTERAPKILREPRRPADDKRRWDALRIGDCVQVYPDKEIGIVYQTADGHGMVGVQVKKQKRLVPGKRLKLRIPAGELYPPDYDFSILFDTVANRKARHIMERKHDPDAVIEIEKGRDESDE